MTELKKKPLFNPEGDLDVRLRRMIGGNTTNLNDFNNMKYAWVSDWYRQAMNNFWIPEEINLSQDVKDYPRLLPAERSAYDKILSFLVFLDSIQTANLPNIGAYITANEVNLCLSIQAFQECVHSQSYSYMLDTICSPVERNDILYQWKTDEHLPQSLLKHLLPLRLLRKGRVQAAQQAELCFCHAVVFHAVLTVFLKIHVAVQFIDGFIVQPQRFLQSLLTVTVGTLRDALIVVQILQEFTGTVQGFRFLRLQHGGVGQKRTILLPDVLQGFGKIVVILHGGAIRITDQLTDVRHLEVNITEHGIRENIDIKIVFHRIEVFLVSGEDEGVVRLSIDAQRHAEHFIPALIPPRLCRRKIAAVDPHIRRQQAAGVGDKGTVPGIVVPLWVNKETVLSLRVEDEQAVPGVIIVSDGIFVLCDEIIVSQQCAAELLEPRAWQLDDLIHGTGFPLVLGLFPPEFCLNNHIIPPISMRLLWLPFITSSML